MSYHSNRRTINFTTTTTTMMMTTFGGVYSIVEMFGGEVIVRDFSVAELYDTAVQQSPLMCMVYILCICR